MFKFFKKKSKKEDLILKEITRQTEELKAINDSMRERNEELKAEIHRTEVALIGIGYSQVDIDKIKTKAKLKRIK